MACTCGKQLTVPTLRGLRELEVAPADAAASRPARAAWNPVRGAAFSGGLAVAAIALLFAAMNFWLYLEASNYTTDPSQEIMDSEFARIDEATVDDLFDLWTAMSDEGLGHAHAPPWVAAQESAKIFLWRTNAAAGVGIAAILIAIGALLIGRRR